MTTIIVSADAPDIGESIAEKTAETLGFEYLGPTLLAEVASQQGVSERDLQRVLDPAAYRKVGKKKRKLLLSHIEAATLERLTKDNMVCAGLAAHLYTRDISHVLMLRILSEPGARISAIRAAKRTSERHAAKSLAREKGMRVRWSNDCFGFDETDPGHYDMVIRMGQIELDKLVELTKDMAGYRKFQPMSYSRKCLSDLALGAKVKNLLLPTHPEIRVRANGDTVIVHVKCAKRKRQSATMSVKEIATHLEGVSLVEVHGVKKLP